MSKSGRHHFKKSDLKVWVRQEPHFIIRATVAAYITVTMDTVQGTGLEFNVSPKVTSRQHTGALFRDVFFKPWQAFT